MALLDPEAVVQEQQAGTVIAAMAPVSVAAVALEAVGAAGTSQARGPLDEDSLL